MSKQSGLFNKRVRPAIDPAQPYKVQKLTASALASFASARPIEVKNLAPTVQPPKSIEAMYASLGPEPTDSARLAFLCRAFVMHEKKNDATLALLGRVEQLLKARTGNDDTETKALANVRVSVNIFVYFVIR